MQTRLLKFFLNDPLEHPDHYTPEQIVNNWDNERLERVHNWVQWAFPLPEASRYQPDSPTLGTRDIIQIRASSVAQANLDALMWRTIDFFDQSNGWLAPNDHNHLRITRIIRSLGLLAPPHKGLMFYHFIMWRVTGFSKPCIINASSVALWKNVADAIRYPGSATAADVVIDIEAERKRQAALQDQRGSV